MIKLEATDHFHDNRVGAVKRFDVFEVNDEEIAKDLAHVSKPYTGKEAPKPKDSVAASTVTTFERKANEMPLNKANPKPKNKAK